MLAFNPLRLDTDSSVWETVRLKASSLRADLEQSLKEEVYNLFSWVRDNRDREIDDFMEIIDHLFMNVRG